MFFIPTLTTNFLQCQTIHKYCKIIIIKFVSVLVLVQDAVVLSMRSFRNNFVYNAMWTLIWIFSSMWWPCILHYMLNIQYYYNIWPAVHVNCLIAVREVNPLCIIKSACLLFCGIEVFMWLDCSCNTGYYAWNWFTLLVSNCGISWCTVVEIVTNWIQCHCKSMHPKHRIVTHCHCEQFDSLCELAMASYLGSQMVCRLFDFRFILFDGSEITTFHKWLGRP